MGITYLSISAPGFCIRITDFVTVPLNFCRDSREVNSCVFGVTEASSFAVVDHNSLFNVRNLND